MAKLLKNKVWHIQTRLRDHHGKSITLDGKWGPDTLAASLNVLGGPLFTSSDVESLQSHLNSRLGISLVVDGKIGPKTIDALLTFLGGPVETEGFVVGATNWILGQNRRKITKAIVHCSATPEGVPFSVEDIDSWHKARGFSNGEGGHVGYHYIIYLDGQIVAGRPEHRVGAHAAPWNRDTIGICYIGGVDKNNVPKDTRTPEQKASLELLLVALNETYNLKDVLGHRDVPGVAKACPSFDVRTEWKKIKERRKL